MSIQNGSVVPIKLINSGFQVAKSLASWLNMPSLSGVRLETYEYTEELTSKISENMIINLDGSGKNIVTDNIVPMPRKWTISAYIGSATVAFLIANNPPNTNGILDPFFNLLKIFTQQSGVPLPGFEPSLYFMPSLKLQVQVLRNAWLNYKLVWFKDKDGTYTPVGIENISFKSDPTIANKVPVSIVLKEIIVYNGFIDPRGGTLNGGALIPDINNPASSYVSVGGGTPNFVSTGPI
jgi:hypothetical protein